MACVMWFCMYVETAERPCKLTHLTHLWMIFPQNSLNITTVKSIDF